MWDTIRSLVATGSTVLLTTQYLDEADQLADRIAVIDTGKVVAEGTADQLKASVGTSSLILRLSDRNEMGEALRLISEVFGVQGTPSPEAGRITAPMSNPDAVTDLLIRFRQAGLRLDEFSVQKPTLDEVFLTITGHGVSAETDSDDSDFEDSAAEVRA
jgi:ABC-2 type transport system ATP-binding protein